MHNQDLRVVAAALLCLLVVALWPATASASRPAARTFAELMPEIVAGDRLTVVDKAGTTYIGKLVTLSESELTIDTEAGPRTFSAGDVVRVDCRRRGPVWNGFVIGTAVVAVPLAIAIASTGEWRSEDLAPVLFTSALWGGGIGTLIDVLHTGNVKVFEAQPKTARTFSVAPVISSARKGVAFTFAW